jgi:hypothetical protein
MQSLSYGGEAIFGGVNAVTPHWAGAVDIVAIRQPDGSIRTSPFYVRFGKYQTFRRNRRVKVRVNDVEMDFGLELGQYGSALFSHEEEHFPPVDSSTLPKASGNADGEAAEGFAPPTGSHNMMRTVSANAFSAMADAAAEALAVEGTTAPAAAVEPALRATRRTESDRPLRTHESTSDVDAEAQRWSHHSTSELALAQMAGSRSSSSAPTSNLVATPGFLSVPASENGTKRQLVRATNGSLRLSPEELQNIPVAAYIAAPGRMPVDHVSIDLPALEEGTQALSTTAAALEGLRKSIQMSRRTSIDGAHCTDFSSGGEGRVVDTGPSNGKGGGAGNFPWCGKSGAADTVPVSGKCLALGEAPGSGKCRAADTWHSGGKGCAENTAASSGETGVAEAVLDGEEGTADAEFHSSEGCVADAVQISGQVHAADEACAANDETLDSRQPAPHVGLVGAEVCAADARPSASTSLPPTGTPHINCAACAEQELCTGTAGCDASICGTLKLAEGDDVSVFNHNSEPGAASAGDHSADQGALNKHEAEPLPRCPSSSSLPPAVRGTIEPQCAQGLFRSSSDAVQGSCGMREPWPGHGGKEDRDSAVGEEGFLSGSSTWAVRTGRTPRRLGFEPSRRTSSDPAGPSAEVCRKPFPCCMCFHVPLAPYIAIPGTLPKCFCMYVP